MTLRGKIYFMSCQTAYREQLNMVDFFYDFSIFLMLVLLFISVVVEMKMSRDSKMSSFHWQYDVLRISQKLKCKFTTSEVRHPFNLPCCTVVIYISFNQVATHPHELHILFLSPHHFSSCWIAEKSWRTNLQMQCHSAITCSLSLKNNNACPDVVYEYIFLTHHIFFSCFLCSGR
jgi:hypothetical protein